MEELDASLAVVSESWFKAGNKLDKHIIDLDKGENLGTIHRSRKSKRGKNAGGGVAVVFDKDLVALKEYKFRKDQAELVGASGKLTRNPRKLVVFGVYLPPHLRVKQTDHALELLSAAIHKLRMISTTQ